MLQYGKRRFIRLSTRALHLGSKTEMFAVMEANMRDTFNFDEIQNSLVFRFIIFFLTYFTSNEPVFFTKKCKELNLKIYNLIDLKSKSMFWAL